WRIGKGHEGWGLAWGLNWYQAYFDTTVGGDVHDFGKVKVRPFMVGYGYSKVFGPVRASANLLGGFALTSFSLAPEAQAVLSQQLGTPSLLTRISNPLVLRPQLGFWINATSKIGVNISMGYTVAHPRVFIDSPNGTIERRLDASMFTFSVGAAYTLF